MNIDSDYLTLLKMVDLYKELKDVEAIGISGSSSTASYDINSDYDIYIYSKIEPSIAERKRIAEIFAEKPEIDNHYFETGDTFKLKNSGKPIDIMYRTLDFIENNIKQVWEEHQASMGYTTCFIDNINKTQILYDKNGWLEKMKKKVATPYPDKLAQNIIKKNFKYLKDALFSYRDQIALAIERNDPVSINHRSAAFLASYFDVIFAKNKLLNPGEKKLINYALDNCKILPDNFELDVKKLAIGEVSKRLSTVDNMVENLRKIL